MKPMLLKSENKISIYIFNLLQSKNDRITSVKVFRSNFTKPPAVSSGGVKLILRAKTYNAFVSFVALYQVASHLKIIILSNYLYRWTMNEKWSAGLECMWSIQSDKLLPFALSVGRGEHHCPLRYLLCRPTLSKRWRNEMRYSWTSYEDVGFFSSN